MRFETDARSFDGVGKLLARLAPSWPGTAYSLAGVLGALRNRVTRRWPSVAELRELFPLLDMRAAARVAADISALYERNRVLVRCVRQHDLDSVRALVGDLAPAIRGPHILVTFHVGAVHALWPALERLGTPVLAFRFGQLFTPRPPLQIESTKGDDQARAAALHRGTRHLQDGGIVVMALDMPVSGAIATQCLGHMLPMAPGPFALARWTGAPITPLTARWTRRGIQVRTGTAAATPDDAAAWLERYLLESPAELTLGLLRSLLGVS